MQVLNELAEFDSHNREVHCSIGMFDGVHIGHQHVLRQIVDAARAADGVAVAITFDQHPARVVAPDRAPEMIYPLSKRLELLDALGIDTTWVIPFTEAFSQFTGTEFIHQLHQHLAPLKQVSVGPDFHFGHRRSGNLELLKSLAPSLGYIVPSIQPVTHETHEVSSTAIRKLIRQGDLSAVRDRLGREYALFGTVIQGQAIGRTIGFPTANLDTEERVLPPDGVYAVWAHWNQQRIPGVMNIGCRPTRTDTPAQRTVEVHLLDYEASLYGETLEVALVASIRAEARFPSLDALKAQIARDIDAARDLLRLAPKEPG